MKFNGKNAKETQEFLENVNKLDESRNLTPLGDAAGYFAQRFAGVREIVTKEAKAESVLRHMLAVKRDFEIQDDANGVTCRICGQRGIHLTRHLMNAHQLDVDTYQALFKGAPVMTPALMSKYLN